MTHFTATNRFSLTGFVFAAAMTLTLHGTVLMGFEQLAKTPGARPVDTLERVVVTTRSA